MHPDERLAAFLAGELATDEHTALEAELARDPVLRRRLTSMRRADAALRALDPPRPTPGFEERLRGHLAPVLQEELARAASPARDAVVVTPRGRARSRWWPSAAAVAAGLLLVLGGAGVVLSGGFGSGGSDEAADGLGAVTSADAPSSELEAAEDGDAEAALEDDTGGERADAFDADDAGEAEVLDDEAVPEADEAPATDAPDAPAAEPADGPVLAVADRRLGAGDLVELERRPEVVALAAQELGVAEGERLARSYQRGLREVRAPEPEPDELDDAGVDVVFTGVRAPQDAELDTVARCTTSLAATRPEAIPAYLELAQVERREVVLVVLVGPDDASARYVAVDTLALDPTSCAPVELSTP